MNKKIVPLAPRGHIIFDHDGTLVNTTTNPFFLFLGMKELLIDLKREGFELYIWTARHRSSVLSVLKELEIGSYFTQIYCSDDGISKPHPMGLELLTAGIEKNKILHIGDSSFDILGAQNFGIEVLAACWNQLEFLEKDLATYKAYDLDECKKIIKRKFYV